MVLAEDEMRQKIIKIRKDVDQGNLVNESNEKYIKMKDSTFRNLFDIGAMHLSVIEKIKRLSDEVDLEITVKSGAILGKHKNDDWIVFTLNPVPVPEPEWFDEMLARDFESEHEVETYFIAPLLEKLGYNYEDIVIEYPIQTMKGSKREKPKRADFVIFNGSGRNENDVLLIIEAKNSDKEISRYDIGEAKYYTRELLPACYIVTNGKKLTVFKFNGMKTQDSIVMDIDKSMLKAIWKEFYRCTSKRDTIKTKIMSQE